MAAGTIVVATMAVVTVAAVIRATTKS